MCICLQDTAKILGNTIMRRLATTMSVRIPYQMTLGEQEAPPLLDLGLGGVLSLFI